MNNSLLSRHDVTNGDNGGCDGNGGPKVMSLLEEVDAFISQDDTTAPVDNRTSIGGPTIMKHSSNTRTSMHPAKRRVSDDAGDKTTSTSVGTAPSDVATNAVTAFLQSQLPQRQSEPEQQHRDKRQRCDDSQSQSLIRKMMKGFDTFGPDTGDDDEPLPLLPQPPSFQQQRQQQHHHPQQYQQPLVQQPRLPTMEQALHQRQGPPAAASVSLSERSFPSGKAPAAACGPTGLSATAQPQDSIGLANGFNLHRACKFFGKQKQIVEIALALDPSAVRRKADPVAKQGCPARFARPTWVLGHTWQKWGLSQERYSYPINIAIQSKASMDVLELLVSHGKDVLVEKDGYERTGSLSVAICQNPCDLDLVDLILFANVQGIMVTDRKLNYPLHVACAKGASVDVIMRLYHHYPAALFQQNFNSETPLDICRRSGKISDSALNFLMERFDEGSLEIAKRNFRNRYRQGQLQIRLLSSPRAA